MKYSYIGLAALSVVLLAWFFRYSVSPPNQYGVYTIYDRWTGSVRTCAYRCD